MLSWKSLVAGALLVTGIGVVAQDQVNVPSPLLPARAAPSAIAPATPVAAGVPGSTAALGTSPLSKQDVDAWLDGYMPYALHSGDIAGAVVVVVKNGQVLTQRGFGYADIAKHTPVNPETTLFRPGSVSKLITWTAVMQQVEAGKIDLDGDVNKYLDFKIPPRDGQPVTMRQIMTHTSGFEEAARNDFLASASDLQPLDVFITSWTPKRIYAAGTTPAYSNWATTLAAYIVQRVSGVPFDNYIETRIFTPLGMQHSTFRQPLPARLAADMATGYARASLPARPFENVQVAPAGSMSASGVDMARFMIAHLEHGRGILRPGTADMMHNSPLDRVNPMSLLPPLNRMELGFFETNLNGHEVIGHLGDTENFHTSLQLMTNDGVGFFLSVNSAGREGAAHPLRVSLLQDFVDRYFPSNQRDGRVDAATARQHAQMMTGLWEGSRRAESSWLAALYLTGQAKVALGKDGELVIPALKNAGGAIRQWVEIAPFVWRERNGHERLAAKLIDGKVVRWSVDGESPFVVFDRVPFSRSSAWLLPLVYASLGVLLLTFLYWPVSWFVRRRYKSVPAAAGSSLRAYRATRLMAGLVLAVLLSWVAFVSIVGSSATLLTAVSDPWLWLLQIAGVIVFVGAVLVASWNLYLTWTDGRGWRRKLWAALVFLAALAVLYFAHSFGLIAMTVRY